MASEDNADDFIEVLCYRLEKTRVSKGREEITFIR